MKAIAVIGLENLTCQLAEVACGLKKGVNWKAFLESMATFALNAKLNAELGKLPLMANANEVETQLVDDLVDTQLDALVGEAIMGTKYDFLTALEQAGKDFTQQLVSDALNKAHQDHMRKAKSGLHHPGGALPQSYYTKKGAAMGDNPNYRYGTHDTTAQSHDAEASQKAASTVSSKSADRTHTSSKGTDLFDQSYRSHVPSIDLSYKAYSEYLLTHGGAMDYGQYLAATSGAGSGDDRGSSWLDVVKDHAAEAAAIGVNAYIKYNKPVREWWRVFKSPSTIYVDAEGKAMLSATFRRTLQPLKGIGKFAFDETLGIFAKMPPLISVAKTLAEKHIDKLIERHHAAEKVVAKDVEATADETVHIVAKEEAAVKSAETTATGCVKTAAKAIEGHAKVGEDVLSKGAETAAKDGAEVVAKAGVRATIRAGVERAAWGALEWGSEYGVDVLLLLLL